MKRGNFCSLESSQSDIRKVARFGDENKTHLGLSSPVIGQLDLSIAADVYIFGENICIRENIGVFGFGTYFCFYEGLQSTYGKYISVHKCNKVMHSILYTQ